VTQQTSLPFGRTDITVEELKQLVDTEEAATQAEKGGVNDAKNQIEDFITCIPDLLNWLEEHGRSNSLRETKDPWKIYLAEILLQRTQGDAVEKIYSDGSVEILRELHVRPVIPRDEGPPEVTDSAFY